MERKQGIALKFDIPSMSMTYGKADSILSGGSDTYVTRIDLILPFHPNDIKTGDYQEEYQGKIVDIRIKVISSLNEDPIMSMGKDWHFGAVDNGLPTTLPFSIFTDNRGKYPCVLAQLVFPYRLSTWIDPSHESGIRMDYNYEEIQVTGPPCVFRLN